MKVLLYSFNASDCPYFYVYFCLAKHKYIAI